MDRFPFLQRKWMNLDRSTQVSASRSPKQIALQLESLEGRLVLSTASVLLNDLANLGAELGGASRFNGFGGGSFTPHSGSPGSSAVAGATTSLGQDAVKVNQAFQTFNSSVLADVAALRQTATTSSTPTTAGVTAYNSAIATAISTLNTSISSDLSDLTNTGTALTSTIEGYTATLQTELESAGTGLASSTNSSVLSLDRENAMYIRAASSQATQAVLTDAPTGIVSGTTLQTFNKSIQTALQTFDSAIISARQTAINSGSTLSSTAITSAVSTLQTSLDSAVSSLGTGFTSSTYNPTTSLDSLVSGLTSSLTSIAAPTAGNLATAKTFAIAVNSVLSNAHVQGNQLVATAISRYNQSLL